MTQLRRILVPVDFSGQSELALGRAVELARATGAEVDVLHVLPRVASGSMVRSRHFPNLEDEMQRAATTRVRSLVDQHAAEGLEFEELMEVGTPFAAILRVAVAKGVDLIVMGTRGHTGVKHLLGSTAERVVRKARCPVLTISQ